MSFVSLSSSKKSSIYRCYKKRITIANPFGVIVRLCKVLLHLYMSKLEDTLNFLHVVLNVYIFFTQLFDK